MIPFFDGIAYIDQQLEATVERQDFQPYDAGVHIPSDFVGECAVLLKPDTATGDAPH